MDKTETTILYVFLNSFRGACGNGLMVYFAFGTILTFTLEAHVLINVAYHDQAY